LEQAAALAKAGHGQIFAAVAEPGVGKSRLFHEFKARNQSGWMVLETISVSHGKAPAYLPVIDLLHGYFRIVADDDQRTRREKLNGRIVTLDPALEDTRPYLFGLLGLVDGDDPLARMDAQIRRRRTQDAIKRLLQRESLNQPVMVIFEDLHEIDDETQSLLNYLADSIGTSRILLLVNYRPEYSHSWGSKTYYTQLRVDPLGKDSADEMLNALLGTDEVVAPLKRFIAEKSEGNPLFMEEIYQALIEEGVLVRNGAVKITRSVSKLKIPATVQAILAARIDRLPARQKDLLETVAVIGKDFRRGLVGKVAVGPNEELERTLADLQLAELIYEEPTAGDMKYKFKHQLTHEVAYNSVLLERRKSLHERVALAIEDLAANNLDDHLTDLAHHYSHSGNRMKALDYLTRAGVQILQRSAYPDAMLHFRRALDIVKEMPEGRSRDLRELDLQMVVGANTLAYQGEGSADAGKALARAVELADAPEDTWQKAYALMFLGYHLVGRGEQRQASEVSRDLYEHVRGMRNPGFESQAKLLIGYVALGMGEFRKAEKFLGAAAEVAAHAQLRIPGHALVCRGNALWHLGFPDQALALAREGVMLGEDPTNPADRYAYTTVLLWAAVTHRLCGELAQAEDLFRRSFNLSTERGFPAVRAFNALAMGLVSALRGQVQAGLEQLRRGVQLLAASSAPFKLPPHEERLYLAWGYELAGKPQEALATLTPAFEWTEQSGAEFELASMHLLKGRLLERMSNSTEAENSFGTSIEIARRQSAKSPELQATTSLARLLAKQGRRDEARAMLADIYNWFTEGFDTADLKDAKALLEELSC